MKKQNAPSALGPAGKKFWKKIVAEWNLDPHHVELLAQAAKCLDRIAAAREIIDREGIIVKDRFGCSKRHPAVDVELQNKITFNRTLREIGLDVSAPENRPPRLGGMRF